ncbi:MAG TPA: hypothetical protein VMU90_08510 [Solirubrobacteraceae bacterium]|nr:hypothetical protein [Solirubrobacteraceae bacterium]
MGTENPRTEPDRSTCTPCRGTGQVISNLGGEAHEVTCPWCSGSGQFEAGRDAQQAPAEGSPQARGESVVPPSEGQSQPAGGPPPDAT